MVLKSKLLLSVFLGLKFTSGSNAQNKIYRLTSEYDILNFNLYPREFIKGSYSYRSVLLFLSKTLILAVYDLRMLLFHEFALLSAPLGLHTMFHHKHPLRHIIEKQNYLLTIIPALVSTCGISWRSEWFSEAQTYFGVILAIFCWRNQDMTISRDTDQSGELSPHHLSQTATPRQWPLFREWSLNRYRYNIDNIGTDNMD